MLDVRQVVDRVSEIAQTVLPHDALSIPLLMRAPIASASTRTAALATSPTPYEAVIPDLTLLTRPWEFQIFDDLHTVPPYTFERPIKAGMRSVLMIPVKTAGQLMGAVNFYSRKVAGFSPEDAPLARRVADHIALSVSHQRLAEEAHHHEELRARAANLELLDELIAALTDTGELPQTFDRVSEIAKKVLPHDLAGAAGPVAGWRARAGLRDQRSDVAVSRRRADPAGVLLRTATGNSISSTTCRATRSSGT